MKKVLCFISALSLCCVPSFAVWSGESFIQDSNSYYSYRMMQEPLTVASVVTDIKNELSSTAEGAVTGSEISNYVTNIEESLVLRYMTTVHSVVPGVPDITGPNVGFFTASGMPVITSNGNLIYVDSNNSISYGPDNDSSSYGDWEYPYTGSASFTLDLSSFNQNVICFGGYLRNNTLLWRNGNLSYVQLLGRMSVYVDGARILDVYPDSNGYFNLNNYIYDSIEPINIVKFNFEPSETHLLEGQYNNELNTFTNRVAFYLDNLSISFLDGAEAVIEHNDKAQDNINQHDAYESQWTGSMTDNFNELSLSEFAFPNGLVSAFGLVSGIFTDIWNGMGEYKIVYVFPLMLGVVLLLIGRISKFGGGQSSSKKDRGDSSA